MVEWGKRLQEQDAWEEGGRRRGGKGRGHGRGFSGPEGSAEGTEEAGAADAEGG